MLIIKQKKILGALTAFLFLVVAGIFLLNNAMFQKYLILFWYDDLSEKYNLTLKIDDVKISSQKLYLQKIYIEDHKKDTLFYASALQCKLSLWDLLLKKNIGI